MKLNMIRIVIIVLCAFVSNGIMAQSLSKVNSNAYAKRAETFFHKSGIITGNLPMVCFRNIIHSSTRKH